MPYDLSYEQPDLCFFATIRTRGSRLWFVNSRELQIQILAVLARLQERYGVVIYAFIIMGNHYHFIARFPQSNKAAFFRDFNGMISKLTKAKVECFDGGLWARRVRVQALPESGDILEKFFYAALNPVAAGLVQKPSEYPSYNSYSDAIYDRRKKFKVVDWTKYNNRKRQNPDVTVEECTSVHTLTFSRLPGHEHLEKEEYIDKMNTELERRRQEIVKQRSAENKGFAGVSALLKLKPGSKPRKTKTSLRDSHRPLVLTRSPDTKERFLNWYFSLVESFKEASRKFRAGLLNTEFPPGTYRPTTFCKLASP